MAKAQWDRPARIQFARRAKTEGVAAIAKEAQRSWATIHKWMRTELNDTAPAGSKSDIGSAHLSSRDLFGDEATEHAVIFDNLRNLALQDEDSEMLKRLIESGQGSSEDLAAAMRTPSKELREAIVDHPNVTSDILHELYLEAEQHQIYLRHYTNWLQFLSDKADKQGYSLEELMNSQALNAFRVDPELQPSLWWPWERSPRFVTEDHQIMRLGAAIAASDAEKAIAVLRENSILEEDMTLDERAHFIMGCEVAKVMSRPLSD